MPEGQSVPEAGPRRRVRRRIGALLTAAALVRPDKAIANVEVRSVLKRMKEKAFARSVAVLRDVSVNKRYDVRVDDELGRMRVVEIRPREVVLSIEEFGVEQQQTLPLKKQEGVP